MVTKTLLITSLITVGSFSIAYAKPGEGKGKRPPLSEEKKAELLQKFDAAGDGELSGEEKEQAREAMKAEFLQKFDTDGDGELSDEERAAAKAARKDKPKKKKGKREAE